MVRHAITIICLLLATTAPAQVPRNVMDWLSVAAAQDSGGPYYPVDANLLYAGTFDDGTAKDMGPLAADWTVVGATTTSDAKFGSGAFHFDAVGERIFPPSQNYLNGAAAYTIACWIKPEFAPTSWMGIFCVRDGNYSGLITYDPPYPALYHENNVAASTNTNLLAVGTWYHLAATWNGSTLKLYKNAVEVKSSSVSTAFAVTDYWYIGADELAGFPRRVRGDIDECFMYSRCLSPDEITQLYEGP